MRIQREQVWTRHEGMIPCPVCGQATDVALTPRAEMNRKAMERKREMLRRARSGETQEQMMVAFNIGRNTLQLYLEQAKREERRLATASHNAGRTDHDS